MSLRFLGVFVLSLFMVAVYASDQQRELEYAQILQQTKTNNVVWLKAGEQTFLGLFTEAEKNNNARAVILLHDSGGYPDQQPLIQGLRSLLPQRNWTTLAIQLPLREMGASQDDYYGLFDEAHARIKAAVEYLRSNGAQTISLIGYGMGGAMAAYSLSQDVAGLAGFAAISLPLPETSVPQAQIGEFIKKITVPFLDIYAEFDLPNVADTARQRRMLGKENPVFIQVMINGENHAYQNDPNMLVKRVYSWLASNVTQN